MEETADLPAALEAWRAIISQGRMTSTYKLALAVCLGRFVQQGRVRVSRRELAEAFLDVYLARLVSSAGTGMPQLADPTKRCVVEQAVYQLVSERITRDQAVERLRKEAFVDVLPRFHTVGSGQVPVRFFTYDDDYLSLTTHAYEVLSDETRRAELMREVQLRWEEQELKFDSNRNRQHDCIFCNHRGKVLENDLALAVYDAFPVAPGHMLIIPKRHFPSFFDASEDEREALFELVHDARILLDQRYHPDGYNIGVNVGKAAGQTIMHAHIHLIPRRFGDVTDPRGGVRAVIPERRVY